MRKECITGNIIYYLIQNALGSAEDFRTRLIRNLLINAFKLLLDIVTENIGIFIQSFNAFHHLFSCLRIHVDSNGTV